jgi:hypothetical protein
MFRLTENVSRPCGDIKLVVRPSRLHLALFNNSKTRKSIIDLDFR